MKKNRIAIYLMIALIIFSSCSKSYNKSDLKNNSLNEIEPENYLYDESGKYELQPNEYFSQEENNVSLKPNVTVRKKIINGNLKIISEKYFEDYAFVENITQKYNGYIASVTSERINFYNDFYNIANFVLKIPVEEYENVKVELLGIGEIKSFVESTEDVDDEYNDINLNLSLKFEEEKRLESFLEKAVTIEEIIKIEDRLSNVRKDIRIYENRKINIERLSSYSTIYLNIEEELNKNFKQEEDSFKTMLSNSFKNSLEATKSFFESILVGLALISIPMIIICFILFILFILYMIFKNHKKSKF